MDGTDLWHWCLMRSTLSHRSLYPIFSVPDILNQCRSWPFRRWHAQVSHCSPWHLGCHRKTWLAQICSLTRIRTWETYTRKRVLQLYRMSLQYQNRGITMKHNINKNNNVEWHKHRTAMVSVGHTCWHCDRVVSFCSPRLKDFSAGFPNIKDNQSTKKDII